MKLSNDVEKYEIEVTKMGQKYSFFYYSTPHISSSWEIGLNLPFILCKSWVACVAILQVVYQLFSCWIWYCSYAHTQYNI